MRRGENQHCPHQAVWGLGAQHLHGAFHRTGPGAPLQESGRDVISHSLPSLPPSSLQAAPTQEPILQPGYPGEAWSSLCSPNVSEHVLGASMEPDPGTWETEAWRGQTH